jgi:hypothetical protein
MSFTGPMFHVFTESEQVLWRDYITSMVPGKAQPALNLEKAMLYVVNVLRQRQTGTTGHQPLLIGTDPSTGKEVTKPISWWFGHSFGTQEDNDYALLGALRNPTNGWIVPGDATASPLITQMLSGNGDMALAFRDFVPDRVARNGQKGASVTFKQVLAMWTDAGCPIHGFVEASASRRFAAAKARRPAAVAAAAVAGAGVVAIGVLPEGGFAAPTAAAKPAAAASPAAKPGARPVRPRIYGMGRPH